MVGAVSGLKSWRWAAAGLAMGVAVLSLPAAAQESPCPATVAVVGGTFINDAMLKSDALSESFTIETPVGTSPEIWCGMAGETPFYYVHGHGGGDFVGAWAALYQLGVKEAIGGATAGAINADYDVLDFIIPDDFIDFNISRPRGLPREIFPPEEIILPRYVPAIDPLIASILAEESAKVIADTEGLEEAELFEGGVVVQAAGGRFETAAEIRMFQSFGSDLVTMNVPTEMAYARIVGINYASIVVISNPAEGLGEWEFSSLGDVYKVVNPAALKAVLAAVPRLAAIGEDVPRVGDALRIHPEMTSGE